MKPIFLRFACAFLLAITAYGQQSDPLKSSTQLLVVTTSDWNAVEGKLQRYERVNPRKSWKAVDGPVTVVVGKNGLGWGAGVAKADAMQPGDPIKKEGDGKAPAGVFR